MGRLNAAPSWDLELKQVLAALGEHFGFSRVALFEVHVASGAGHSVTCQMDWARPGLRSLAESSHPPVRPVHPDDIQLDWAERRTRGEVIEGDTRDLTGYFRAYFEAAQIVRFYTAPVMSDGRWWGHLCVSSDHPAHLWTAEERAAVHFVTEMIARGVERSHAGGLMSEAGRKAMLEVALDGVISIDEAGLIQEFNPAAEQMFGYSRAEVIGHTLGETVIPPQHEASHKDGMTRYLTTGASTILGKRVEIAARRSDGRIFPVELTITEVRGHNRRLFTAYLRDISERVRAQDALETLAFEDPASGLPNRAGLVRRVAQTGRQPTGAVVLQWPELDMLAASLGESFANQLLAAFAGRVGAELPVDAVLARTGEREVAAVLFEPDAACRLGERLEALTHAPLETDGRRFYPRIAIGIAAQAGPVERLLPDAEMASRLGVGLRVFDDSLRADHQARLAMETSLRETVTRRAPELFPVFQPIVETGTRRIVGFEALARWQPEPGRNIPPSDFIPVAEAAGLVDGLGECILDQAVRECAAWNRARAAEGLPPRYVAVNLAAPQLAAPDLVARIRNTLERYGHPGSALRFELTESIILQHQQETSRVLEELRQLGCAIAIDDFGTGYSSFSYLERLPVDVLKIDRSFLSDIVHNRRSRKIVAVMVKLAHGLGMSVVAEGIDDRGVLEEVEALGCDFAQGFLLGRPMSARDATVAPDLDGNL